MANVFIPSLMQSLTDGEKQVRVEGSTVRQIINNLDGMYPGVKARLVEDDRVKPNISVAVEWRSYDAGDDREGERKQRGAFSARHRRRGLAPLIAASQGKYGRPMTPRYGASARSVCLTSVYNKLTEQRTETFTASDRVATNSGRGVIWDERRWKRS